MEGAQLLLNPFCGSSGTSLMEGRLAGLDAVGIDLNPCAVLLACTKTADYALATLLRQARQLRQFVNDLVRRGVEVPYPSVFTILTTSSNRRCSGI
jgi:tRNA G10  N-methylase Trm11